MSMRILKDIKLGKVWNPKKDQQEVIVTSSHAGLTLPHFRSPSGCYSYRATGYKYDFTVTGKPACIRIRRTQPKAVYLGKRNRNKALTQVFTLNL